MKMRLTFDAAKNDRNIVERKLPFALVASLDWETAQIQENTRKDYGEVRYSVAAFLADRLYIAIITIRKDATHVISFRKANNREVKSYGRVHR